MISGTVSRSGSSSVTDSPEATRLAKIPQTGFDVAPPRASSREDGKAADRAPVNRLGKYMLTPYAEQRGFLFDCFRIAPRPNVFPRTRDHRPRDLPESGAPIRTSRWLSGLPALSDSNMSRTTLSSSLRHKTLSPTDRRPHPDWGLQVRLPLMMTLCPALGHLAAHIQCLGQPFEMRWPTASIPVVSLRRACQAKIVRRSSSG